MAGESGACHRVARHWAVRGCSSAMVDQPSPGASTWIISGVAAIALGIHAMAAWKCAECTCASPAARSLKASSSTNWLGRSTLLDHSKKRLPGSARVAAVKGATRVSHWSATSGRMENFTAMKIIVAPCTSRVTSFVAPFCTRQLVGWGDGMRSAWHPDDAPLWRQVPIVSYVHDGHESMRTGVGCVARSGQRSALDATGAAPLWSGAADERGQSVPYVTMHSHTSVTF